MVLKLYKMDMSSPCRAVFLTAKALCLEMEYIEVDLLKWETRTHEFIKMNPQHTVPTLDDDGKILWDSHAINVYLVTKYGKNSSLYPNDVYTQALINQRLHFDNGVLFPLVVRIATAKIISDELLEEIHNAYELLNKFLDGHKWSVGDSLTLADFSLLQTTASLNCFIPISETKYPNIIAWRKLAEELPYYNVTTKGVNDLKNLIQSRNV